MKKMKKVVKTLAIGLLLSAMVFNNGDVLAREKDQTAVTEKSVAYSQIGYAVGNAVRSTTIRNVVSVDVLTTEGKVTLNTQVLSQEEVDILIGNSSGNSWAVKNGSFIEICYDKNGKVITFNKLYDLTAAKCWFDTMKYGAEFSPVNNDAGKLLAAGWVLDKDANEIVIGDTNHFEETYSLAKNVKVYEINTETKAITAKKLSDLPVTQMTDGKFSKTPNRQMAIVVFDSNYEKAEKAKATEIYYITPQTTVEEKYLLDQYDTMSLYSYHPDTKETGGVLEKPASRPWLAYTKPFTIVEDKMYYAGDNDVACYLFNTENGLALLDVGWQACGYLYWDSIEELGFDPRDIKYVLLSHGHLDHYGAAYELVKMLQNSGNDPVVYETYEDTFGYDIYGYSKIGPTFNEADVRSTIDKYYEWEKWMEFGNGIRMKPIISAGHTPGTASFIFEVTPDGGDPITFGYMGGFGTVHTPDKGYARNAFVYGLRYLQQNVEVDYSLPQHTAHFPMLELNKAAEQKGISFLDALIKGNDEWCNFLERRMAAQEMQIYHDRFTLSPFINVNGKLYETQKAAPALVSIEKGGPWKREGGEYNVKLVDSGKLLHGFNILENPNELLRGVKTLYGDDLGDGVMITRDGYMHDPDKWFIQISLHVDDAYEGKFTNLTNGTNGPVEAIRENWSEIVRTVYFDSKEDAEAVLSTLQAGNTYKVTMDKNSNILIPEDITQTFRK